MQETICASKEFFNLDIIDNIHRSLVLGSQILGQKHKLLKINTSVNIHINYQPILISPLSM